MEIFGGGGDEGEKRKLALVAEKKVIQTFVHIILTIILYHLGVGAINHTSSNSIPDTSFIMGSGSPPSSKPSAIPSHMLNGSSPLQRSTGSRDARERESLNTSIRTSFEPRIPIEFESPETKTEAKDVTETETETVIDPAPSTSSASVPIRSVAPVRYVYSDINIETHF